MLLGRELASKTTARRKGASLRASAMDAGLRMASVSNPAPFFQTSEIENEWAGELSDTVKEDLTTRAEAVAKSVREGVDTVKSEISDAGAESIDRLKHTGKDALNAACETTTGSVGIKQP